MKEHHLLGKLQILSFYMAVVSGGRSEALRAEVAEIGRSLMAKGPACHGE